MRAGSTIVWGGVLLLAMAGCGRKESGVKVPEELAAVTGVVTMDGQPLAGAAVLFTPGPDTHGQGAFGVTDADGKYELTHYSNKKGIPPGRYMVVISKYTLADGSPIPEGQTAADANASESIPAAYSDANNTQLSAEVPSGGKTFDFELKKDAKVKK